MLKHSLVLTLLLLASAASGRKIPDWIAGEKTDEFTDTRRCVVERREGAVSILASTQFIYYPFIERRGDDLRVGIISGGRFKIPVGVVRLRIDTNEAWTIDPAETPIDMSPVTGSIRSAMVGNLPQNADPKAAEAYQRSMETVETALGRALSPYTVATGEKARAILEQMRHGDTLIYQTLGINQASSTTGRMKLGAEFLAALQKCGL